MSTLTTRLALYKPDSAGTENVNVVTDLNNNLDKLDSQVGVVACTSGTRPATPYNGQMIRETDTGKMYICTNTVGPVWTQLLYSTADYPTAINLSAANQLIFGGSASSANIAALRGSAADVLISGRVTGDTSNRFTIQADGKLDIGPGGGASPDTNIYRSAANTLKTDDNFITALNHTVLGDLFLGTRVYRNKLASGQTVANTTTETVIASMTIPAADMIVGAIYRIKVWALASVTGTPTAVFRARISGVAGTLVGQSGTMTASSGVTNKPMTAEIIINCISTGAAGTIRGNLICSNTLGVAGAPPSQPFWHEDATSGTVTVDTTVARDLVLTWSWGTASASNTVTAHGYAAERVA